VGADALAGPDMTEDELLAGVTDALTLAGWTWTHIINSRGVTMGHAGLFDLIAANGRQLLLWELKSRTGQLSTDQLRWHLAMRDFSASLRVDVRVIRPDDYDRALEVIVRGSNPRDVFDA